MTIHKTYMHNRIIFLLAVGLLFAVNGAIFPGCGDEATKTTLTVSGHVTLGIGLEESGVPVFVAVTNTIDKEELDADPKGSVIEMVQADPSDNSYLIDLSSSGLLPGDTIYLIAFADTDYTGNVPYPTPGDFMGIYISEKKITPGYILTSGENKGLDIEIDREVFDYDATIKGTLSGEETGLITLVAYAGQIDSSDFSGMDFSGITGYTTIEKTGETEPYEINILPYGHDLPITNLQVFALFDADRSETISPGDMIGFYPGTDDTLSEAITIPEDGATISGIDPVFRWEIPVPSEFPITLAGAFSVPDGYLDQDFPIYLIVADADDLSAILSSPYDQVKSFYKLPASGFTFDLDLTSSGLAPGDEVAVIALWDKDETGGFPAMTPGDKIGIVENKDTYSLSFPLAAGTNVIPPQGYSFNIDKNVYGFDASLSYALDMTKAGTFDPDKAKIMVLLVHVDGISFTIKPVSGEYEFDLDIDYLLGVDILPATQYDYIGIGERTDPIPARKLPILTALYHNIVVWEDNEPPQPLIKGYDHGSIDERTAYLFAILDKNGNGQLDPEDEYGYYTTTTVVVNDEDNTIDLPFFGEIVIPPAFYGIFHLPTPIPRITKRENKESRCDGETGPYWITMNPGIDPLP